MHISKSIACGSSLVIVSMLVIGYKVRHDGSIHHTQFCFCYLSHEVISDHTMWTSGKPPVSMAQRPGSRVATGISLLDVNNAKLPPRPQGAYQHSLHLIRVGEVCDHPPRKNSGVRSLRTGLALTSAPTSATLRQSCNFPSALEHPVVVE